jgi:hypothetical protein
LFKTTGNFISCKVQKLFGLNRVSFAKVFKQNQKRKEKEKEKEEKASGTVSAQQQKRPAPRLPFLPKRCPLPLSRR